jgi:glutathione peroxidase
MRLMDLKDRVSLFFASQLFRGAAMMRRLKERPMTGKTAAPGKIYEFELKTIEGKPRKLSEYKGKVLLIVNVASQCGFTPQYEGLERLHKAYQDRGLRVLGFPANEFGAQEPGTDAEIKQFCKMKFGADFDLFSKIVVKGAGIHPLYKFLTTEAGHDGEIPWNFAKFLVGKDGAVAARFGPETAPESKALKGKIEELLAA